MRKYLATIMVLALASSYSFAGDSNFDSVVTTEGNPILSIFDNVAAASADTFITAAVEQSTGALIASGTFFIDGDASAVDTNQFTQIIFPARNIVSRVSFAAYEGTSTYTGTLAVSGYTNLGDYTTETIVLSTLPAPGDIAWCWIDTFTVITTSLSTSEITADAQAISTCTVLIGTGNKIGLPGDIRATSDMYFMSNTGVNCSSCAVNAVDVTYDTVNFAITGIAPPTGTNDYILMWLKKKEHN